MRMKIGHCDQCERDDRVIAKTIPSSGRWCVDCNEKRLGEKSPRKRYPLNKTPKPTGEAALFQALWSTRPHRSFVSGTPLGDEMSAFFFGHVMPKSTYPEFRLFDRNIQFLTIEEHFAWDSTGRDKLRSDPDWDKMFSLEAELKELYNKQYRHNG